MKNITSSLTIWSFIVIGLILVVNAVTLMRFPAPHGDEAWMASRAWEFLQSGSSFGPLDNGVLDRYEGYEHFYSLLSSVIQSFGVQLFGTPSLLSVRFVSFIIGLTLLIAVYWIGKALDGRQLGLLGVAFTAFSWPFFLSAHLGRPDIIAAALGFTGIALYLNNRSAKIWLSALAGLAVALAIEVHANAVIYGLTIFVLYFYKYKLRIFRKSDFWGFIIGTWIGIAFYLSLHVFPNPQTFLQLNKLVFTSTHLPPMLTGNILEIWKASLDMALMIFKVFPQIIIGLLVFVLFKNKRLSYLIILLIINLALLLSFTLLVRNKFFLAYAIYFTPGLSILIAAILNELLKSPSKSPIVFRMRQLFIASICLLPLFPILMYGQEQKYQQVQSRVTQAVKPNDTIMGNQLYWFGLKEHRYINWSNLVLYRRENTGSSLKDAFLSFRPDIFIFDDHVKIFTYDGESTNNYQQQFRISKSELASFLYKYAELETTIEDGDGDPVQIYRINWELSVQ